MLGAACWPSGQRSAASTRTPAVPPSVGFALCALLGFLGPLLLALRLRLGCGFPGALWLLQAVPGVACFGCFGWAFGGCSWGLRGPTRCPAPCARGFLWGSFRLRRPWAPGLFEGAYGSRGFGLCPGPGVAGWWVLCGRLWLPCLFALCWVLAGRVASEVGPARAQAGPGAPGRALTPAWPLREMLCGAQAGAAPPSASLREGRLRSRL